MAAKLLSPKGIMVLIATFMVGYLFSMPEPHQHGHRNAEAESSFMAEDIPLTGLDGKTTSLFEFKGKWVLLNFWATWCPPCVEEMPSLSEFSHIFKDKNLVVLAVSMDKGDVSVVKDFVKKLEGELKEELKEEVKLDFQIFHDPKSLSAASFDISGLPTTYLISPTGEVLSSAVGGRDWADPALVEYFKEKIKSSKEKIKSGG